MSIHLPRRTPASEVPFSRRTSTSLCWWLSGWSGFLVLISHARYRRAGNCIGLLSNTVLLLSTDSKLLVPCQYHLITCDSQSLLLFQFSHFWRQNFVVEVSDLCFSSPSSEAFDNQASISSDEFPCLSILIRF